jgi:valyl-tRNA synthetase
MPGGEQADDPSIMRAPWPSILPALVDRRAEDDFDRVREVVSAIRSFRADHHVESDAKLRVHLSAADAAVADSLGRQQATIALLGRVQEVTLQGAREDGPATRLVAGPVDIVIPLEGVLDLDAERTRLAKALEKVRSEIARFAGKLASDGFRSKAPAEVVAGEQRKLDEARATEEKLQSQLQEIGG